MALTQRLEFRQSQALVMTPQLMQAIKLLQLSNLDLAAYVEGELERNPLLERTSEGPGEGNQPARKRGRREAPEANGPSRGERLRGDRGLLRHRRSRTSFRTPARRRRGRRRASPPPIRNGPASARAAARTATTISKPSSPPRRRSRITWASSLRSRSPDPVRRMIGRHLIDLVDEAGYLTGDLDAVAERLGAPPVRNRGGARDPADASIRPACARET